MNQHILNAAEAVAPENSGFQLQHVMEGGIDHPTLSELHPLTDRQ